MKSQLIIFMMLTYPLCAMYIPEVPIVDAQKLQLNAPNTQIDSEHFAQAIKNCPRLQEISIPGHILERLPAPFPTSNLERINLNNGQLRHPDTINLLLTSCKNLKELYIAHNKLATMNEWQLPSHKNLEILNCNNNQITELNFATFRRMLPNLKELSLSGCPLTTFKVKDLPIYNSIPNINLMNTALSDSAKKQIIAASKRIESCYECNPTDFRIPMPNSIGNSLLIGGAVGLTIGFPLFTLTALTSGHLNPDLFLTLFLTLVPFGSSFVAGTAISYISSIGCRKPEEREIIVFNPIFDAEPDYTEEEVTTGYQRFIRHFPYFLSICQRSHTDDPESTPLTHITSI